MTDCGDKGQDERTAPKPSDDDQPTEKEKYFEALRNWLHQAQLYQQATACFPYYFMTCQMPMLYQSAGNTSFLNNNYQQPGQWPYHQIFQNNEDARPLPNNALRNDQQGRVEMDSLNRHGGFEYTIPPLWKRFLAEQIDFFILVFIKLTVTYIAVDYFEFIDLDNYDVETIRKKIQEDYSLALEMTSEILVLELVYRVVVCLFEACCLSINFGGRPGGATPGKAIFRLRVISASVIIPVENRAKETVIIYPGTGLTFSTSLLRAAVKNALIALLFPIFTLTFFFQHNRTAYDIMCNVLVVEEGTYPPRRNRP